MIVSLPLKKRNLKKGDIIAVLCGRLGVYCARAASRNTPNMNCTDVLILLSALCALLLQRNLTCLILCERVPSSCSWRAIAMWVCYGAHKYYEIRLAPILLHYAENEGSKQTTTAYAQSTFRCRR